MEKEKEKEKDKKELADSRANKAEKACKNIEIACMGLTRGEAFGCLECVKMTLFQSSGI